jgi:hypothetical protein
MGSRAERARKTAPPPPLWKSKISEKALPKMRGIFDSEEVSRKIGIPNLLAEHAAVSTEGVTETFASRSGGAPTHRVNDGPGLYH